MHVYASTTKPKSCKRQLYGDGGESDSDSTTDSQSRPPGISRFGGTALSKAGTLALLELNPFIPGLMKTMIASIGAAGFRMVLTRSIDQDYLAGREV